MHAEIDLSQENKQNTNDQKRAASLLPTNAQLLTVCYSNYNSRGSYISYVLRSPINSQQSYKEVMASAPSLQTATTIKISWTVCMQCTPPTSLKAGRPRQSKLYVIWPTAWV